MDKFIEQQRLIYPMSDEAIRLLIDEMDEVSFPKGDLLIREGDRDPFVWFVRKGLIRSYVERETKDITLWFASDGEMINFVYRDIAAYNIEMVEDSDLLRIPARRLEELFEQSHDIAVWGLKLLDYYLREYENYLLMIVGVMPRAIRSLVAQQSRTFPASASQAYRFLSPDHSSIVEPYSFFF